MLKEIPRRVWVTNCTVTVSGHLFCCDVTGHWMILRLAVKAGKCEACRGPLSAVRGDLAQGTGYRGAQAWVL
jgi:hypothetical protein